LSAPTDPFGAKRMAVDPVSVLIVDDHAVVIEGLTSTIGALDGFTVVGTADDGAKALRQIDALHPDIVIMVIMDVSMPGMNGIQATKEIKERFPGTKIVIYTMHSDREYVIELFEAGMDGYVLKQDPMTDLLRALDAVRAGGTYYSTKVPRILSEHLRSGLTAAPGESELTILSKREIEVFILLADGRSVKEIAAKLYLSPKTVESHKYNIMAKLNLNSVTEMTKLAIRLGVISA